MVTRRKQIIVIVAAIIVTVTLYFLPQQKKVEGEVKTETGYSFKGILTQAKGQLKPEELEPINKIEAELAKEESNPLLLDSLGKMWDLALFPVVSAYYFEQIANLKPDEQNWLNAAYRYFDAFKGSSDSTLRSMMVDKAIASYQKVLDLNPDNLNAQTDLGVCYAEGTAEPMKGIMMLRAVVEKDPQHANAQFNLGVLSVRSGQLDKAVERFYKALDADPARVEARYLLGRTLIQTGSGDKGIEQLRQIEKYTSDPQVLEEVNKLIHQVNNQ
ncbi:MAG TPA: tetratricopeptide repeat protein [Bacteroidia bacterium]|nr:tetratricopeptide repeat protein [Bacteroidia bacterium]HNS11764.1 tetratricopeptide repeat protein [Bacteroidia bacterium]